jgi:hypothetical protein
MLVGGIGLLQVRGLVDVAVAAGQFEASGAVVQVLNAPGRIDGAQCEALSSYSGIASSGALRAGEDIRLAALPSTALHTFEATPGLAAVLGVSSTATATSQGVWLSGEFAEVIGADSEPLILPLLDGGSITTSGMFAYPSDGRLPALSYTLVSPVPATGAFDACWVRIWPEDDTAFNLLLLPWRPSGSRDETEMPRPQQLNTTLGIGFDASRKLAAQPVWPLTFAAIGVGAVLGFATIRTRRLELASTLHAGLDKTALITQVGLETAVWVLLGCLLLTPALGITAAINNPDPIWSAWYPGLRTVFCAGLTALFGAVLAAATTQEKHLFRYFKQR